VATLRTRLELLDGPGRGAGQVSALSSAGDRRSRLNAGSRLKPTGVVGTPGSCRLTRWFASSLVTRFQFLERERAKGALQCASTQRLLLTSSGLGSVSRGCWVRGWGCSVSTIRKVPGITGPVAKGFRDRFRRVRSLATTNPSLRTLACSPPDCSPAILSSRTPQCGRSRDPQCSFRVCVLGVVSSVWPRPRPNGRQALFRGPTTSVVFVGNRVWTPFKRKASCKEDAIHGNNE